MIKPNFLFRIKICKLSISLLFIFSVLFTPAFSLDLTNAQAEHDNVIINSTGTDVGGIISSNTTWTIEGSPYNLTSKIQIDTPATLTIESGVVIMGNQYSIQTWGTLNAVGTQENWITFNETHIEPGSSGSPTSPFLINISYAKLMGGSIYRPTGHAVYGSISLTNSYLWDMDSYMYIWYPVADCIITGNTIITESEKIISAGIDNEINLLIRNNAIQGLNLNSSTSGLIENWAAYDSSEMIVEFNSFLNTNSVAVALPSGYTNARMSAINNFWGTTNTSVIESMILDRNDDLERNSYIEYEPFLSEPHPDTPQIQFHFLPIIFR